MRCEPRIPSRRTGRRRRAARSGRAVPTARADPGRSGGHGHREPLPRARVTAPRSRAGSEFHLLAWFVTLIARQRMTDPTSGFRAVNRRGIVLFAADYPHDYPEAEANVGRRATSYGSSRCPSRCAIVPQAAPRSRPPSLYYMIKVMLALFVSVFRRYSPAAGGTMTPSRLHLRRHRRDPAAPSSSSRSAAVGFGSSYALLWLVTGVVLLVFAVWREGLNVLAGRSGYGYPPALFRLRAVFTSSCCSTTRP